MKTISTIFVTFSILFYSCSSSDEIAKENLSQIIRTASRPIQAEAQSENYVIRQGDQIKISVWGYPEFTSEGLVKETGTFTVPLIGELVVGGLTKEQFTEQLKQKLAVYIKGEMQLSITVISTILPKVAVLGAVTRQDNYTITNDVSLIEILSTAGGTTQDSDLRHIKIIRTGKNSEPIEVDLITYIEKGIIETIPMVRPGDTVYIPKKSNIVRELSDFMRDAIFIFGFFRIFN
jgi:protein involved in polysaccharide export with SLBB domain